jgi:hypothetical protein
MFFGVLISINALDFLNQNINYIMYDIDTIGIIGENKIKFYTYSNGWNEDKQIREFIIPDGCQGIIRTAIGKIAPIIGIRINNRIKMYAFRNGWVEFPELEFSLPNGYVDVLGIAVGDKNGIGVIINDKIKMFSHDNVKWIEILELEFSLPDEYNGVIYIPNDGFGVIINNRIKMYGFDNKKWIELSVLISDIDFTLPNEHNGILCIGLGNRTIGIGVILEDEIKIYIYENGWNENIEARIIKAKNGA